MTDNMRIWEQVDKTDPKDTKKVNTRGGFTAVDANSQFRKATEIFGPIGIGWGVEIVDVKFPPNDTVAIQMSFWFEKKENNFPVFGCCNLGTNKADEDAFKKAQTDGMTKALSMLGFNHDVFQGKFDDNKYVQQRQQEEAQWVGPLKKTKLQNELKAYIFAVNNAETIEAVDNLYQEYKAVIVQAKTDDPASLEGDGEDHRGIVEEVKAKKARLQHEQQLKAPE